MNRSTTLAYKMIIKAFLISNFIIILTLSNASAAEKKLAPMQIQGTVTVSAEDIYELIINTPELIIIDSRKPTPYSKGHIQNAINILDSKMTEAILEKHVANKFSPIVFYCNGKKCLRSANAAKKALAWGYSKIYWFRGGWKEWQAKNMPVEK